MVKLRLESGDTYMKLINRPTVLNRLIALICLLLLCFLIVPCNAETPNTTDFEALFEEMTLDELKALNETMQRILNDKIVKNATLIISPEHATIAKGDKLSITVGCEGREINKKTKISFTSSDENVVSISDSSIKAVGSGEATVTVSALFEDGGHLEAQSNVSVYAPVSAIKITPSAEKRSGNSSTASMQLLVGKTLNIAELTTVIPEDASEKGIIYSVDDDTLAEINSEGILTAKAKGSIVVTALSKEDTKEPKKATLKVKIKQPVESIAIKETTLNVGNGSTHKMESEVFPANADDQTVTWTSSNPEIAKITKSGTVTGVNTGTTTITCAANDGSGVIATAEITVITEVKKITLSDTKVSLEMDNSTLVSAKLTPENVTNNKLIWSSSDTSIASVDTDGRIKGKNAGKCTITATAEDGGGATASVTVYVEPHIPVNVTTLLWHTMWGVKDGTIGVEAQNLCINKSIKSFDYIVECTSHFGNTVRSRVTYKGPIIKPGKTGKSGYTSLSVSGFTTAYSVSIIPETIYFTDGTSMTISDVYQKEATSYFTM